MPIKIDIALSSGGRFKPVSSRTFNEALVTIGRDEDCTLTLEDTHKHVSRVHAELAEEDGVYWMKVVSKVNPVIVNGKRLMSGNRVALADGDTLAIGLYRLEVHAAAAAKPAANNEDEMTFVAGRPPAPPGPPATAARPAPAIPAEAEEATYVPPPKAPSPAAPAAAPAAKAAVPREEEEATFVPKPSPDDATNPSARVPAPPPEALDLDFDLSDGTHPSEEATFVRPSEPSPPPRPETPPARTPSAAFMDQSEVENADEMTMIRRPAAPAPAAAPPAPPVATPPSPRLPPASFMGQGEGDGADEMTMIGRPPPPAAKPAVAEPPPAPEKPPARMPSAAFMDQTESENADEMTMIRRPSAPAEPPKAPPSPPKGPDVDLSEEMTQYRPAAPAAAARPAGTGGDAALRAFLEGAGLAHLDIPDPEAFMRESGAMVRAAVEGVMMLLIARGEARRELGADASDAEGADNPLKSISDPAEVITFLFDPKRPAIGDVDPIQAFSEACGDLRAHQVALLASIRAAAMVALASFDPAKIERDHGTSLGGLNLTRKSKLWDISIAQHEKLSQDAVADFASVFGREILVAYNAQAKKVRGR